MFFIHLWYWFFLLLLVIPICLSGVIIFKSISSLKRAELLFPAGAILGLSIFVFIINSLGFIFKGGAGIIISYILQILLTLIFLRIKTEKIDYPKKKALLLYGPPGTGKTLLAKAVAKESEANFIQVKGPSLLSMWVGKSEEGVRKVFERARQVAPCVVFFDEIDSLAGKRGLEQGTKVTERVLNQLLAEIDGLEGLKDVTIIGATNRPDMLDPALLRPGRFDRIILADVPDEESRLEIFKVHTKNTPLAKDVKIMDMVKQTDGYVGADIEALVREAAINALRKNKEAKEVTKDDFDEAFKRVKASVSQETAQRYKKIEDYYLKRVKAGLEAGPLYTG